MVRILSFGATFDMWKSIECPSVPSFFRVKLNWSPIAPRYTGPGTKPSKVHSCCFTPGAISPSTSLAVIVMVWTLSAGRGGRIGSRAFQSAPGLAVKSIWAPVSAGAVVAVAAPPALPAPPVSLALDVSGHAAAAATPTTVAAPIPPTVAPTIARRLTAP